MEFPVWTKPALWGAATGAVAMAVVGFTWGGWVTGGTARNMADSAAQQASTNIVASLCVNRFAAGPDATAQLGKLKSEESWKRSDFIEKGGWANIPGLEKNMSGVASACADRLVALEKLPVPAAASDVSASAGKS